MNMMPKPIKTDTYSHDGKDFGRILPPHPSDINFDYLDVVRIPFNGLEDNPMSLIQIALVDIDTDIRENGSEKNDSERLEARLERVPNIDACKTHCSFNWARRTLVRLPIWRLGAYAYDWEDEYMMYMCLDKEAGLPLNEYLTQLANISDMRTDGNPSRTVRIYGDPFRARTVQTDPYLPLDVSDVKVYGDAFVFKKKSVLAVNAKKRTRYLDNFVDGANMLHGDSCSETEETLRKLLIVASEIDKKLSNLDVVRIPCRSTLTETIAMENVPLISIGISTDRCNDLEARLGRVPNLREGHSYTFSWTHRSLVKVRSGDLGLFAGTLDADHLMYMCLDKGVGLPPNQFLGQFHSVPVYGDAFIFRMEPNGFDESGRASYIHMVEDFVLDARGRNALCR